jgi:hypothetical protein
LNIPSKTWGLIALTSITVDTFGFLGLKEIETPLLRIEQTSEHSPEFFTSAGKTPEQIGIALSKLPNPPVGAMSPPDTQCQLTCLTSQ